MKLELIAKNKTDMKKAVEDLADTYGFNDAYRELEFEKTHYSKLSQMIKHRDKKINKHIHISRDANSVSVRGGFPDIKPNIEFKLVK